MAYKAINRILDRISIVAASLVQEALLNERLNFRFV
jgi:hypothetical protein